uniref:Uncharacterized protein n=1 Tax=Nelumbo nucifera TaxID=4432 RepID=A0A822XL46_NELNU|nr:TPA_asm: hypothetical protein HUJ06_022460 [Nelumbo nucifera]
MVEWRIEWNLAEARGAVRLKQGERLDGEVPSSHTQVSRIYSLCNRSYSAHPKDMLRFGNRIPFIPYAPPPPILHASGILPNSTLQRCNLFFIYVITFPDSQFSRSLHL